MRKLLSYLWLMVVMLAIVFLPIILGLWADSVSCRSQATKMRLSHSYGPLQGCMVEIRGQWYPLDAVQYTNGRMEVYPVQ